VEKGIKDKVGTYKKAVIEYKQARDKDAKSDLKKQIANIKKSFTAGDSTIWLALDKEAVKQNEENEKNGLFSRSMEWMIEFPELMDENGYFVGFDCIVGNPPYMKFGGDRQLLARYKFAAYNQETNNLFAFFIVVTSVIIHYIFGVLISFFCAFLQSIYYQVKYIDIIYFL
jgi:hypothetical protein